MTDSTLCRRGDHCANPRTTTTTTPDGQQRRERVPAWAEDHGLCRIDLAQLQPAIQQLPRDYWELSHLLGKTSSLLESSIGRTRTIPAPIRLSVLTLQEAIVHEVTLWAAAVDRSFVDAGSPSARLRRGVQALQGTWPALLEVPEQDVCRLDGAVETTSGRSSQAWSVEDGVTGALALLDLHGRVERVEGRLRRAQRLWSPCPRCQALGLEREEGGGQVDCRRCGHRMPLGEYEVLAGVLARAYEHEVAA